MRISKGSRREILFADWTRYRYFATVIFLQAIVAENM